MFFLMLVIKRSENVHRERFSLYTIQRFFSYKRVRHISQVNHNVSSQTPKFRVNFSYIQKNSTLYAIMTNEMLVKKSFRWLLYVHKSVWPHIERYDIGREWYFSISHKYVFHIIFFLCSKGMVEFIFYFTFWC